MSTQNDLDGVRVQTARMLEIYSLLRRELDSGNRLGLPAEARARLQSAVDTIAANMRQLAVQLAAAREHPSPEGETAAVDYPGIGRVEAGEARELEEILDAVLQWHADLEKESHD